MAPKAMTTTPCQHLQALPRTAVVGALIVPESSGYMATRGLPESRTARFIGLQTVTEGFTGIPNIAGQLH